MANFSFGAPNTGAAPVNTFGAKPLTPNLNTGGSFSFGAQSTPTSGFFSASATPAPTIGAFGNTASTLGAFGTQQTATPTMGTIGGFGNQVGATSTIGAFGNQTNAAPTAAFSGFGKPALTQPNLFSNTSNFGSPATGNLSCFAAAVPTLGASTTNTLFGQKSNLGTTATNLGLGIRPIGPARTPQAVGLGGVDINSTQPKAIEGKNESGKVKESQVPQEIVALVDNLKVYIKQQKEISSEIAKTSTRKLFNVANEIQTLNWTLSDISNLVDNNYVAIKTLRSDTAEAIQHAEMSQRTHETPACLQYENTAPIIYFMNLVQKYESDLIKLRSQVQVTEKHMRSLTNPQKLSAEDLKKGLHQIHESFISLASRIHEIHQKVEEQKEQYLNLRKCLLRDKTNVFEAEESKSVKTSLSKVTSGPTPFSAITGINLGISLPNTNKDIWGQTSVQTGFGFKQNFGSNYSGTSAFGGPNLTSDVTEGGFSLQKPPLGTKRNKH